MPNITKEKLSLAEAKILVWNPQGNASLSIELQLLAMLEII